MSIFISNIPSGFTEQDMYELLSQANINVSDERAKICTSRHTSFDKSTGRYMIVAIKDDTKSAIDALSNITITIQEKQHVLQVDPFIPNFRKRVEEGSANIVIMNLPADITSVALREAYSSRRENGQEVKVDVLCARVVGDKMPTSSTRSHRRGYVMFKHEEDADKAIEATNGKYLGKDKVFVTKFKSIEKRIDEGATIFIKNIPPGMGEEEIKELITKATDMKIEDALVSDNQSRIKLCDDKRPPAIRSDNKWCVVQAVTKDVRDKFLEGIKGIANQGVMAFQHLTAGIRAAQRNKKLKENTNVFVKEQRNISIYGIAKAREEEIINHLKTLDIVQDASKPHPNREITDEKYHINVLFKTKEAAAAFIAEANEGKNAKLNDFKQEGATISAKLYMPEDKSQMGRLMSQTGGTGAAAKAGTNKFA